MRKIIPDCYWPSTKNAACTSHETICVVNPHAQPVKVRLTLYFEDREKVSGYETLVQPERAMHIRMDELADEASVAIPHDTPYAILLESDQDIPVQYTRADAARPGFALMTTMV